MSANPYTSTTKAALWMGAWLALMLGMTVAGREVTAELSVLQLMELRSVLGFFMFLPPVFLAGGFKAMKTQRMGAHISRNIAHYVGQALWLYALTLIPLAHLISIEFTTPIWTAPLAVVFLGERLNARKLGALVLGLIGVMIIVRPGATELDPGHLVVLASALAFAASLVLVKSLTRTETVVCIIFWMLAIQSIIGLIPALATWEWPRAALWPWILTAAFCGSFGHYCLARALVHADATVVVPMDFMRLPLTALIGYLFYNESIDLMTALGAGLILCGNLVNLQRRPAHAPA
ncbi:MAG: DMT family transporter [Rhizobiaceae bacterium]|nr:DMT family transporter [Rhizobiaceae bacterium]